MTPNNAVSRFMAREIHPLSFVAETRIKRTPEIRRHANRLLAVIELRPLMEAPKPRIVAPAVCPRQEVVHLVTMRPEALDAVQIGRQKRDHRLLKATIQEPRKIHREQFKLSLRDRGAFNPIDTLEVK